MLMMAPPIYDCYCAILEDRPLDDESRVRRIYMSPQGRVLNQRIAAEFCENYDRYIILCGHYEGVDRRIIDEIIDEEISLGAFVLTGDEPPADAPGFPAELQCVQALDDLLWQCGNRVRNTMLMALECTCNGKTLALDDDGACEVKLDPETADSVLLHGRFTVRDRVPEDLRIWFEKADFAELKVNGHALLECNSEFLFAPENVSVPIGQYCHLGVNEVTVRVPLSPWMRDRHGLRIHFHMLMQGCQPLVLMGTFAAEGDHTIAALPEKFHAGALEVQGFGMFADKLTLSSSFDAPEWQVVTHLAIADTLLPLAVELNGVALGVRFWQNEALCIPENVLKASGNQLKITLYGEMKNMLGRGWLGGKIPKTPFILPTFELTREIY